jgi:hypothetical protein
MIMPKLDRDYWEALYNEGLAFTHWPKKLFGYLLTKVYGPPKEGTAVTPATTDSFKPDEDVLMMFIMKSDAPTQPSEPVIGPGP